MSENNIINKIENSELNKSENLLQRFPQKWTFYFYKNDQNKVWIDNMRKVTDIEIVQEFWGLMHHVLPPSKLTVGNDYYLFKKTIKPMWEDERNANGGMWLITFEKKSTQLDSSWLEILMSLVGETFEEDAEEICGAVVNIRGRNNRMALWTSNSGNYEAIKRIGQKIKNNLNLVCDIQYNAHNSSNTDSLFTI